LRAGGARSPCTFRFEYYDVTRLLHDVTRLLPVFVAVFTLELHSGDAFAQSRPRIWDVVLGSPIGELPLEEFVDPACGTNGGPPSLPLEGFKDFNRCPVEQETGLREVWFIYDDEREYIARAERDETLIGRYSANNFYSQPIITSLFIDNMGLVQGYRVITDPRAPAEVRIEAYLLSIVFKGMRSMLGHSSWVCTKLPRGKRERPIENVFIKESCKSVTDERLLQLEIRHMHKPGQDIRVNPRLLSVAEGEFESSTRLEVYNIDAVRGAPCCPASVFP